MSFRLSAVLMLFLAAAGSPAGGQELQLSPTPGSFAEVLDVRVVNVEVVVTDEKGTPVFGLGPGDFELLVDGTPTPIDYFTEVRGGLAVAPAVSRSAGEAEIFPDLAPGEPVGTSYLLFIDDFFTEPADRDRALLGIEDSLAALNPEDRMAIVAYDGEQLAMLSTWSSLERELVRALRRARERPAYGQRRAAALRQLDRDAAETLEPFYRTELDELERQFIQQLTEQVDDVTSAIAATLRSFARPPGRKVMLLLSGGWPLSPGDYVVASSERQILEIDLGVGRRLLRRVTDTANLLGYTLFPVDVPGLSTQVEDASVIEERLLVPLDREVGQKGGVGRKSVLRENQFHASLQMMAEETGGRAMLDEARAAPLQTAKESTRSYYWLGFTPDRLWDDDRRRLQVRAGDGALTVRARTGYLDSSQESDAGMAIESALLFGSSATEEGLRLEIGEVERAPKRQMEVPLIIWIPIGVMESILSDSQRVVQIELRIAASDESGEQTEIPPIPLTFTSEELLTIGKYIRYEAALRLRREEHRLVVGVHDPLGGKLLSAATDVSPPS